LTSSILNIKSWITLLTSISINNFTIWLINTINCYNTISSLNLISLIATCTSPSIKIISFTVWIYWKTFIFRKIMFIYTFHTIRIRIKFSTIRILEMNNTKSISKFISFITTFTSSIKCIKGFTKDICSFTLTIFRIKTCITF